MKNNPLFAFLSEFFDRMLVVDKHGKKIFFPWGDKKQGYYIKDNSIVENVKTFHKTSILICFALLTIAITIFENNFSAIIVSMLGWYFVIVLYIARITKSLPPAEASYKEVILGNIESGVEDEASQTEI